MVYSLEPAEQGRFKIVAAIPCFNTEPFIAEVVSKVKRHVDQVIVVNDGSRDSTTAAAKAAGALVVEHPVNKGYGEAIKSCFEAARANAADILVTLDGDAQHNPEELPQLLAPILRAEADLVIGSRFLGGQTNMPRYRKFGIDVITFLYNFGSRVKVTDAQSGFRSYNRQVLEAFRLSERGMAVSVELLVKARGEGFKFAEVPISCLYHSASSNLNPVFHGLSVALNVVKLRFSDKLSRSERVTSDLRKSDLEEDISS